MRGGRGGTVSKSHPVRQGCIKIHTLPQHQSEYRSMHRSCPAATLREKCYKGVHTCVLPVYIRHKAAAFALMVKEKKEERS